MGVRITSLTKLSKILPKSSTAKTAAASGVLPPRGLWLFVLGKLESAIGELNTNFAFDFKPFGRRLPGVENLHDEQKSAISELDHCFRDMQVSAASSNGHLPRYFNSLQGRCVGLSNETKVPVEQSGANKNEKGGYPSGPLHALRGFVHRYRSLGHALLGFEVKFLVFVSFGFAALAGEGGFRVFDETNGNRKRSGWLFLLGGSFLALPRFALSVPFP